MIEPLFIIKMEIQADIKNNGYYLWSFNINMN